MCGRNAYVSKRNDYCLQSLSQQQLIRSTPPTKLASLARLARRVRVKGRKISNKIGCCMALSEEQLAAKECKNG